MVRVCAQALCTRSNVKRIETYIMGLYSWFLYSGIEQPTFYLLIQNR